MRNGLAILDLGRAAYRPVLELQRRLVSLRVAGDVGDVLVLVEHDPVYTLGRNASPEHVLLDETQLRARGIDLVRVERGGDVTYHGPGQLVGYPILHLGARTHRVAAYVHGLEEVLIRTAAEFGVRSARDAVNPGVWVGPDKLAALGVRITRRVTMHGFALNVKTNLSDYMGIVPCGIAARGVTSLGAIARPEKQPELTLPRVKQVVITQFLDIFGYDGVLPPPDLAPDKTFPATEALLSNARHHGRRPPVPPHDDPSAV